MSILIKGMEMPKSCYECNLKIICDYASMNGWISNKRDSMCPLVGVKEPHGRLIDIKSLEDNKFETVENDLQRWWNGAIDSIISNAPTVIEAEGKKND